MNKEIEFKILKIENKSEGKFNVQIQYMDPEINKEVKPIYCFKVEDQINDAFLDKIKKSLDDQFNTSVEISADRFVGKTFNHKFNR